MGRDILAGHLPYTTIWDHKPPGIYYLFAAAMSTLGAQMESIRILTCVFVAASCTLLYIIGRSVFQSTAVGWLAGLFYAAHSIYRGGMAANAEVLFTPFIVMLMPPLYHNGLSRRNWHANCSILPS